MALLSCVGILAVQSGSGHTGLTAGGWMFVAIAWATIISVLVFCYRKVIQKADERKRRVQGAGA